MNMSRDSLLLNEWFISQYEKIYQICDVENMDEIDYFKTIGLSLTIFTIFEFSMTYFFDDFKDFLINDPNKSISQLPSGTLSKIFSGSDLPSKLDSKELFSLLSMTEFIHEKNRNENFVKDKLKQYFTFKHFNVKESSEATERFDALFFDSNFLDNDIQKMWFSNQDIRLPRLSQNQSLDFVSEIETKKFGLYISEYSSEVRHILAHRVPLVGNSDNADINYDFFSNKNHNSPKYASIIFKEMLTRMYDRYKLIHDRDIFIDGNYSINSNISLN